MNRCPAPNASHYSFSVKPSFFGPLYRCFCNAVKCNLWLRRPISGLFFRCCPPAVIFEIPKIAVDSIDTVIIRKAVSHVAEKILKLIPPLTNINSRRSISFIGRVVFILAPRAHTHPYPVLPSSAQSMGSGYFAYVSWAWHVFQFTLDNNKNQGVTLCPVG